MVKFDVNTGRLFSKELKLEFADRQYHYALSGFKENGEKFSDSGLADKKCLPSKNKVIVTGRLANAEIELLQVFQQKDKILEETITLKNVGAGSLTLDRVEMGFIADITHRPGWRLCAIPFRVQLDGSVHDYDTEALVNGRFQNAVYSDKSRPEPFLTEGGALRSEAWAWGTSDKGLVIVKYNNDAIELSVSGPQRQGDKTLLRFGGVGFCLYGEPSTGRQIAPGKNITFGTTTYITFEGGLSWAFYCYRNFLDEKGHGFPRDYDPPVNWNELYDVGWYHSDQGLLAKYYTREALLKEAEKAKACGCELLYLDPGWEVAEGLTLWDEARLGPVSEFVKILESKFGLGLGYRTILRCYRDYWPHKYLVQHSPDASASLVTWGEQKLGEPCLCNPQFWEEKLKRILEISRPGIKFMMFDEMDWRGPCYDASHNHPVPTTPLDHILAVYRLCQEVRKQCPGLIIEAHDPVWPWGTSIYVPTYFQQGFGDRGCYDENWGFEYMWDCIKDLKSGKALALYYYTLGCNVPLYLHITMAADNDNCLFFWWAASTVRHLGIGGKQSNKTIEPAGLPAFDPEKRFSVYQNQMKIYQRLKPYFVRGQFCGLTENIHLHTLKEEKGGVVNVFNLTDKEQEFRFNIPLKLLGTNSEMDLEGAGAKWSEREVELNLKLKAMSPAVICIGDSTNKKSKQ